MQTTAIRMKTRSAMEAAWALWLLMTLTLGGLAPAQAGMTVTVSGGGVNGTLNDPNATASVSMSFYNTRHYYGAGYTSIYINGTDPTNGNRFNIHINGNYFTNFGFSPYPADSHPGKNAYLWPLHVNAGGNSDYDNWNHAYWNGNELYRGTLLFTQFELNRVSGVVSLTRYTESGPSTLTANFSMVPTVGNYYSITSPNYLASMIPKEIRRAENGDVVAEVTYITTNPTALSELDAKDLKLVDDEGDAHPATGIEVVTSVDGKNTVTYRFGGTRSVSQATLYTNKGEVPGWIGAQTYRNPNFPPTFFYYWGEEYVGAVNLPPLVDVTLHRALPKALSNTAAGGNIDAPLLPVTQRPTLKDSTTSATKVKSGLVCDGVTPLLLKLNLPDAGGVKKYAIEASIVSGGKLMNGSTEQTLASHLYLLSQGGTWQQAESVNPPGVLVAPAPTGSGLGAETYAFLSAIPTDFLSLDTGSRDVKCRVTFQEVNATGVPIGEKNETLFSLAKPPVVLVHGYNTEGSWGDAYLASSAEEPASGLEAERPPGFVRPIQYGVVTLNTGKADFSPNTYWSLKEAAFALSQVLKTEVEHGSTEWHKQWAFTRYDAVGHSQGGVLLRMLSSARQNAGVPAFRDGANFNRGRFRRVISIGSPHNGISLMHYLFELKKNGVVIPAVLGYMGVLQRKFDPWAQGPNNSPSQIEELNGTNSTWAPDPGLKYFLIRCTIDGGESPGLASPPVFYANELAFHGGSLLLPRGGDGAVDLDSQGDTSIPKGNVYTVPPEHDISHSGGVFGIGLCLAWYNETDSPIVAEKVREALAGELVGPAEAFGPFPVPPLQPDSLRNAIEAEVLIWHIHGLAVLVAGAVVSPSEVQGAGGQKSLSVAGVPTTSAAAGSTYEFNLRPDPSQPVAGMVSWIVELFGPDGVTQNGISLMVDPLDSRHVTVSVDAGVVGDVILYATHGLQSGGVAHVPPIKVVSLAPQSATLQFIELAPANGAFPADSTVDLQLWANYSDGTRLQVYVDPASVTFSSSDDTILTVSPLGIATLKKKGEAEITATYKGVSVTGQIHVLSSEPPVINPSALPIVAMEGSPFSYQFTASNDPTNFGASGLPDGLTMDPETGVITGTPVVAGDFTVTLEAANAAGTGSQDHTFKILARRAARDTFDSRIALGSSVPLAIGGNNSGATLDSGEEDFGGIQGATVWYEWTAPVDGWFTIATVGSEIDTVLGLAESVQGGGYAFIGFNHVSGRWMDTGMMNPGHASRLVFHAEAGKVYAISVGGYVNSGLGLPAQTGNFELAISAEPAPVFTIQDVTLTPNPVDVTMAEQQVTVQVAVVSQYPLAGEELFTLRLIREDAFGVGIDVTFDDTARVSGSPETGVYEKVITIPRYLAPGGWIIKVTDNYYGGTYRWTAKSDDSMEDHMLIPADSPPALAVANSGAVDSDAPTLVSVSGLPAAVNLSDGDATFNLAVVVNDALSGFDHGTIGAVSAFTGGTLSPMAPAFGAAQRTAGTAASGTYVVPVTISQYSYNGTYYLQLSLSDAAINTRTFTDDPSQPGGPIPPANVILTFTVTGGYATGGISVEQPAKKALIPGLDTVDFGPVVVGQAATRVFTIRNTGTAPLYNIAVADPDNLSGGEDYTVTAGPQVNPLEVGGLTTFTVKFAPVGEGVRTAILKVTSSIYGSRNPFYITLTGSATAGEIAVEQPAGTELVHNAATIDFGTADTGSGNTLNFTVKNKGVAPLVGLSVIGAGAAGGDFVPVAPIAATLAAGASTTFSVKFSPRGEGLREAALHIANSDPTANPFIIGVTGTGVLAKPVIAMPPAAQLVGTADTATFTVTAAGLGQLGYQWLKNNAPIDGAPDQDSYAISLPKLADAGLYAAKVTSAFGSVTSTAGKLGVVNSATTNVTVNEGTTLTLKVAAAAPAGTVLTYQWKKNGVNLTNGGTAATQVITGADKASLSITKATPDNDDTYTCVVGMGGLTKTSGEFHVTVLRKPIVNPAGPLTWYVSSQVTNLMTATNDALTFTFSGLPAGVKGSSSGQLSGKPTKAAASGKFTVTARNGAGPSAPVQVNYSIQALAANVIGTFHGIVARETAVNSGLGSRFELTTTGSGSCTGKIISGATTASFKGQLNVPYGDPAHPKLVLAIPRKNTTALNLDVTFNATGQTLAGSLAESVEHTANVSAWRTSSWNALLNKATDYALLHSFSLEAQNSATNAALPQGFGYAAFAVKETTGALTVAGRLADGSTLITATFLGPQGQVLVYQPLYANQGSVAGVLRVTKGATKEQNTIAVASGQTLDWKKPESLPAAKDTLYPDGWGPVNLIVKGGAYPVPAKGQVVIGLPNSPGNAQLTFSLGGLEVESAEFTTQPFDLLNPSSTGLTNKATLPPFSLEANPNTVTLPTVTPATGLFSGTFTLQGATPAQNRKVNFQGQIIQDSAGSRGCGYFLLPSTTTTGSPRRSGLVILEGTN